MTNRILPLGDGALTLEFGTRIDPALHRKVMAARASLRQIPGITDVVPTYRSLTVHFDPLQATHDDIRRELLRACAGDAAVPATGRAWEVPVCFGGDYGPDLADVASATGLDAAGIVDAVCALELRVYLIGFLPGFPYLGELPEPLRLPRRSSPRLAVPANSVAMAGAQMAIYPWRSPGGWHLLGRTPLRLFDPSDETRPALFAPGDTVRFKAIPPAEFVRLDSERRA